MTPSSDVCLDPPQLASVAQSPSLTGEDLRRTATLALPLLLGHISTALVGFIDTVLAGRHGGDTLAAVATGAAIWQTVFTVSMGVLLAVPPSVSQLDGAGRRDEIGPLFRQALWLALGLGLILLGYLSIAPQLLRLLGVPAEVRAGAGEFLHGIRFGAPALALYLAMRFASEGLHWTLPTMVIGFSGVLVLAPLGYALMFGAAGLPALGAAGLGYASAIVLWLEVIAFALYLARARRFAELRLFARIERPRWQPMIELLRVGGPIAVMVFMEGSMFVMGALLVARLGAPPVAAHQIALNVATLCFMVPMGLAEATTVRVGHAIGARDPLGVRRAVRAGFVIMLLTQAVLATTLVLGRGHIAGLYTTDVAIASHAALLILIYAVFQFSDGVQVLSAGALRGLKDTSLPMVFTVLAYWGVGLPLGALLALGTSAGASGMWLGLGTGLSAAALMLGLRLRRSLNQRSQNSEVRIQKDLVI